MHDADPFVKKTPSNFRRLIFFCTKFRCVPSPQLIKYFALSKVMSRHSSVSSEGAVRTLTSHDISRGAACSELRATYGFVWRNELLIPLVGHILFRVFRRTDATERRLRSNRVVVVYAMLSGRKLPGIHNLLSDSLTDAGYLY
jgi:hypothetical protein